MIMQTQPANILSKRKADQTSGSFQMHHFRITLGWEDCAPTAHSSLVFTQAPERQQEGCYRCLSLNCDPGSQRSRWVPANCAAAHSSSARSSGQGQTQRKQPSVYWVLFGPFPNAIKWDIRSTSVPCFPYWIDGQQVGQEGHDGGGGGRFILQFQPLSGDAHTGACERWWEECGKGPFLGDEKTRRLLKLIKY